MGMIYSRTNPYTAPMTYHLKREDFWELLGETVVSGNIVDIVNRRIFQGKIHVEKGIIVKIEECKVESPVYIIPGFVDSHVHVESSMLVPSKFARLAVKHGVVGAVCDPHEIANVMGEDGVQFMIDNGKQSRFKFFFGAPSCVPATDIETSGAILNAAAIKQMMNNPDIYFLGEMMNFPGVVAGNGEVMQKIKNAQQTGKPVDGHAPGLRGDDLKKYAEAGITTDHECVDICEAEEKMSVGMNILIREGSAAKNFEMLYPLINQYPSQVMLCTDDLHPDDMCEGYINQMVKRGLEKGLNFFNLMQAAILNPIRHYKLPLGLLREGDPANMVMVDNLEDLTVLQTYIDGRLVYDQGEVLLPDVEVEPLNNFNAQLISEKDILVPCTTNSMRVIEVVDKEIYTKEIFVTPKKEQGYAVSDLDNDILKVIIVNRYINRPPVVGFVKGFGLKHGAIAGSIAHDSHNLIAIGTSDEAIVKAMNAIINRKGGIAAYTENGEIDMLPLPIAGLMSAAAPNEVAEDYQRITEKAKALGSNLTAPFMTMAFISLIVVPDLKIFDKGLFNVKTFQQVSLFV